MSKMHSWRENLHLYAASPTSGSPYMGAVAIACGDVEAEFFGERAMQDTNRRLQCTLRQCIIQVSHAMPYHQSTAFEMAVNRFFGGGFAFEGCVQH